MALYGVTIEKETRFHGGPERFNNTYYYELGGAPTDADLIALADFLVAAEKPIHTGAVAFKTARVWTAGGTIQQNVTVLLRDLTGVGSMIAGMTLHAEASVLVEWETNRTNVLGRKVYLRKFIRPQGLPLNNPPQAEARDLLAAGNTGIFKTYADAVDAFVIANGGPSASLRSENGRTLRADNNGNVDVRLRTREFRRN